MRELASRETKLLTAATAARCHNRRRLIADSGTVSAADEAASLTTGCWTVHETTAPP